MTRGRKATTAEKPAKVEKPKLEGYSQEEAAKRVGCAQSTVGRAIKRGDIELLTNGRVPESAIAKLVDLRKEDEKLYSETADLERRLLAAETGEREAKMKLRQMEVERESGRFVELAIVQRDAADTAERIVAVLRAVPQRTALALECQCRRAAVVEKKIGDEIERAIAELGESTYASVKS